MQVSFYSHSVRLAFSTLIHCNEQLLTSCHLINSLVAFFFFRTFLSFCLMATPCFFFTLGDARCGGPLNDSPHVSVQAIIQRVMVHRFHMFLRLFSIFFHSVCNIHFGSSEAPLMPGAGCSWEHSGWVGLQSTQTSCQWQTWSGTDGKWWVSIH